MPRITVISFIFSCFCLFSNAQEADPLSSILESLETPEDSVASTADTDLIVTDTLPEFQESSVPIDSLDEISDTGYSSIDTVQSVPDTLNYIEDTMEVFTDTSYFIPGDDGYSLILAADDGDIEAIDLLVSRGADLDAATSEGVTALMYASHNGFPDVVNYLLQKGAEVNAVPENGITALISASKTGDYEICEMLLDSGAYVDNKDYNGLSALMYASAYNYPEIIELCLENGAAINQRDWLGNNPLLMAACFGNFEAVDALLDLEAHIDSRDYSDFTALHIASQNGDYDLTWLLVDRGANVHAVNKGMLSPLALAVDNGHQDIVELLLESGADINQKVSSSRNSLDIASENKDEQMTEFLVSNGARANRGPEISNIHFTTELDFSGHEFMLGQAVGIKEKKTGFSLETGYMFRPIWMRILDIEHELYATQYWERRHLIFVGLDRNLKIFGYEESEYGIVPGVRLVHSWSNYRGSDVHPERIVTLVPVGGLYWKADFFQMNLSYEYFDYKVYNFSPHRFSMTFRFYINLTKDKYSTKHIPSF